MSYIDFVVDSCNNATEAMEKLNSHYVLSCPMADEAAHCRLVAAGLEEVERQWRARHHAQERLDLTCRRLSWEAESPEPNTVYLTAHHHLVAVPNHDRHPKPWCDQTSFQQISPIQLIPFSYPSPRPDGYGIVPVKKEEEDQPLAPSPPTSPRRLVSYPAPTGPIKSPVMFKGAGEVIKEENDQNATMSSWQANQILRLPGNPGAVFRVPNPSVHGTKVTWRDGFRPRRHLAFKAAVKSSYPY